MSERCENCIKLQRERDFWRRMFRYKLFEYKPDMGISPFDWQCHSWLTEGVSDAEIDWVLGLHPSYLPGQDKDWSEMLEQQDQNFLAGFIVPPRSQLPPRPDIPDTPAIEDTKVELLPPAPTAELVLKQCKRCNREQALEAFADDRTGVLGKTTICKICYQEDRLDKKAAAGGEEREPARVLTGRLTMAINEAVRHIKAKGHMSEEQALTIGQKHSLSLDETRRVVEKAQEEAA